MGLDMYLFKITKLNDKEIANVSHKHIDEIKKDYHYFELESYNKYSELYNDLEGLISKIPVKRTIFEHKRCYAEHNISESDDLMCRTQSPAGLELSFRSGAKIKLNREELKSYLKTKDDEVYIYKSEDVAYWRKDYDLQNFFYNRMNIENCGYHLLSEETKQELKNYLLKYQPDDFNDYPKLEWLDDEDVDIFYYEWW